MVKKQAKQSTEKAGITTMDQVSAGGVAFHWRDSDPEMAVVSVKPSLRRADHRGYLHPDLADAAGGDPEPDDQFSQVRLLRTGAAGKENRLWQPGGLCQLCGGR